MSRLQCIAILGQNNAPLYLGVDPAVDGENTKWFFLAHGALDMVEEHSKQHTDQYLGLLMSIEDNAIYGYLTNTRIKFLLMLQQSEEPGPDADILPVFRAIYTAYTAYMANPFVDCNVHLLPGYDPEAGLATPRPCAPIQMQGGARPIESPLFAKRISEIAGWGARGDARVQEA
ncbi:hypothetical protein MVES1_002799 [Malassezia vespertilionis]|uniref:uncharacterized protein n=1 Tax=Malassezia vespertilionis TaxID=2020962 RepID=UPI0024B108B4|nr:uncharacterized protein MVES1_002799 [Malassezia vespertilionis]WFD07435.1 hypothetical protein MVES1_002799 [Malassezia vespertilionis]